LLVPPMAWTAATCFSSSSEEEEEDDESWGGLCWPRSSSLSEPLGIWVSVSHTKRQTLLVLTYGRSRWTFILKLPLVGRLVVLSSTASRTHAFDMLDSSDGSHARLLIVSWVLVGSEQIRAHSNID
jgi:hypothetical protein